MLDTIVNGFYKDYLKLNLHIVFLFQAIQNWPFGE